MSKILAAVIALAVVTTAAAPSFAADWQTVQSTTTEK